MSLTTRHDLIYDDVMSKSKLNYSKVNLKNYKVKDAVVSVYRSGHSKVVTIPAYFPVEIGGEFTISTNAERITLVPVKKTRRSEKTIQSELKKLHKLIGQAPGLTKGLDTIEKLEDYLEGVYD